MKIRIEKIVSQSLETITEWAETLSKEQLQQVLTKLRNERNFYKGILNEDYRGKNPKSQRYLDAESKVSKINTIGKKLNELLNTN